MVRIVAWAACGWHVSGWHGIVRFWRVFDVGPKFSVGVKIVLGRRGSKFYLDQNVHARPLSKAFFNLFFD